MTLYSIILFLHVAAALVLFASLSFEFLSLSHLRQASDLGDVRRWVDPVPGIPLMAMTSILVVLVSGIYLAVRMGAFDLAWPKVTIVALVLIAPFGGLTGQADARHHPPQLGRSGNDEIRTSETRARSLLEDFARRPNRSLSRNCSAHGRQARIGAIDRHCDVFFRAWSFIGLAAVAPDWTASRCGEVQE